MNLRFLKRVVIALALGVAAVGPASADIGTPVVAESAAPRQVLVLIKMPAEHVRPNADYGGAYGDPMGQGARRRLATRLAKAHGLTLVDGWPMPLLGLDCFIMNVPDGVSPEVVAASMSHEAGVQGVEVSHGYRTQGLPVSQADPLYRAQPATRRWRMDDLHELSTGRGVHVAVVDSMVDRNHPDLVGQVQLSEDFVSGRPTKAELHGTGVAGIIAARANNGVGISGVAPDARILALRACWQQPGQAAITVCDTVSLAKAIHYAIDHGADVINLSLGGPEDLLLGRLIDVATSRGIKVVAAYDRNAPAGGFPASHPGVVAVADDAVAPLPRGVYSAPGRDVPTTQPGGAWFLVSGSSYSAAHVSGLLALVRERRPLEQRALALVTSTSGGGEIDACASLVRATGRTECACARSH